MTTSGNKSAGDRWRHTHWVHWLAFGLGSGSAPKAPGTMGSLAALLVLPLFSGLPLWAQLVWVAVAGVAGVFICGRTAEAMGVHDHGGIVWDEFVGIWITFIAVPLTPVSLVAGFLLFRLFDVWKPWPIRLLDRRLGGGIGIMLDDVLAGVVALILLQLGLRFL